MKRARILILLVICLVVSMAFGGTALASSRYTIRGGAEGEVSTVYDWSIQKTVDTHGDINLSKGESQVVDYAIALDKDDGTFGITVSGTLTLNVNASEGIDIRSIKARLHKSGGGDYGEKTLPSEAHYGPGTYTFDYDYSTTDALGPGNYRIEYDVDIVGPDDKSVDAPFTFGFSVINDEITVVDTLDGSDLPDDVSFAANGDFLGTWGGISDDTVLNYQVMLENQGNKKGGSGVLENTAVIQETEESSSASVEVTVPKEKTKTKTVEVVVTPVPSAAPAPLPKTGGLVEWELIALAGGMLTSCGGGLYLLRRRRMKK